MSVTVSIHVRRVRPGSEAETVALFLSTELPSDRWQDDLRVLLERAGRPDHIVADPDLGEETENQARLRLWPTSAATAP